MLSFSFFLLELIVLKLYVYQNHLEIIVKNVDASQTV